MVPTSGTCVAEGVGFEPTVGKPTPVFKTGTFGRSVIPPSKILDDRGISPSCRARALARPGPR